MENNGAVSLTDGKVVGNLVCQRLLEAPSPKMKMFFKVFFLFYRRIHGAKMKDTVLIYILPYPPRLHTLLYSLTNNQVVLGLFLHLIIG